MNAIDKGALILFVALCIFFSLLLRTQPEYERWDVILEYAGIMVGIPWAILRAITVAFARPKRGP